MYYTDYPLQESNNLMYRVFGWMALALGITAIIAYYISASPSMYIALQKNPYMFIGIIIAQFALVIALSMFIMKMNFATAVSLFLLYAASMGVTLSSVFLVYNITSIYVTALVTACMFATMCLYGYFTRTDLTKMGSIAFMALIGIIIASLVNWWLKSAALDFAISIIGVLLFTVLTAYDVQKIRIMSQQLAMDRASSQKIAVIGALTLYLDFINLFLFLLRFMGRQRNNE